MGMKTVIVGLFAAELEGGGEGVPVGVAEMEVSSVSITVPREKEEDWESVEVEGVGDILTVGEW